MNNVTTLPKPPLKLAEMTKTASEHSYMLTAYADNREMHPASILSVEVCAQIDAELGSVLDQTCSMSFATKAFAKLMAYYAPRASDNSEALDAYTAVMLEELQRFPPPVLREVLPEFGRTHPHRPHVSEVCMACQAELDRLQRLRRGLERMGRQRAEQQRKAAEEQDKREREAVAAAERDANAVSVFGSEGVRPGDYAAAERTFLMIESRRGGGFHSPWMTWSGLVRKTDPWPAWIAAPMRRAGIFGRAELAVRRGQGNMAALAEVHRLILAGDDAGARHLCDDMEATAIKVADVDPYRPHPLLDGVAVLAEAFRSMLDEPAAKVEDAGPGVELEPVRGPSESPDAYLKRHSEWWDRVNGPAAPAAAE